MINETFWNEDKTKRLTLHKCASCGQMKVIGWQKHWQTDGGAPEGIRNQYGKWNWVAGGHGDPRYGKLLLCDSCLHFEPRIHQKIELERKIKESIEKMKEIHDLSQLGENDE